MYLTVQSYLSVTGRLIRTKGKGRTNKQGINVDQNASESNKGKAASQTEETKLQKTNTEHTRRQEDQSPEHTCLMSAILFPLTSLLLLVPSLQPNILKDVSIPKRHPQERGSLLEQRQAKIHQGILCRNLFGTCNICRMCDTLIPHCKLD